MPAEVQVTFSALAALRQAEHRMPAIMAAIGSEYANEVKRLMRNSPATGRTYKSSVSSALHRASAPGEPPAPDSGQLLKSVRFRTRRLAAGGWVAEAGSSLKKALWLEYGAARGVRGPSGRVESVQWILFPRPAWGPALRTIQDRIPEIIRTVVGVIERGDEDTE
jgi:hypothetical protein